MRNLADLIAAQLEFHKRSYEILSELAPAVDGLQVEQEVCRFLISCECLTVSRPATVRAVRERKHSVDGVSSVALLSSSGLPRYAPCLGFVYCLRAVMIAMCVSGFKP